MELHTVGTPSRRKKVEGPFFFIGDSFLFFGKDQKRAFDTEARINHNIDDRGYASCFTNAYAQIQVSLSGGSHSSGSRKKWSQVSKNRKVHMSLMMSMRKCMMKRPPAEQKLAKACPTKPTHYTFCHIVQ
jgi:hypothetical protein